MIETVKIGDLKTWGAVVQERRKAIGLSRLAVAKQAGISRDTVLACERAQHVPERDTVRRICAVLVVPPPSDECLTSPEFGGRRSTLNSSFPAS